MRWSELAPILRQSTNTVARSNKMTRMAKRISDWQNSWFGEVNLKMPASIMRGPQRVLIQRCVKRLSPRFIEELSDRTTIWSASGTSSEPTHAGFKCCKHRESGCLDTKNCRVVLWADEHDNVTISQEPNSLCATVWQFPSCARYFMKNMRLKCHGLRFQGAGCKSYIPERVDMPPAKLRFAPVKGDLAKTARHLGNAQIGLD